MFRSQKSVLLALAAFCIVLAAANTCQVSVSQQTSSSWNDDGSAYQVVNAVIKNTGSSAVSAVTLLSSNTFESTWSINANSGQFTLPDYVSTIAAGDSFTFGYIIKSAQQATFNVNSVECTDGSSASGTPSTSSAPVTSAPTKAPTHAPGHSSGNPTTAPTQKPTTAPTTKPTTAPTTKPTTKPTQKPTSAPTTKPTSQPTSTPTSQPSTSGSTPNGRMCPAGQVWAPTPGTTWQWQLTGTVDTSLDVQMYDIDLFDNTAATIALLHSQGKAVICYFSTQYENWRPDASEFTAAVIGAPLDGWPGENYVDIRTTTVRNIMTARLDLAVSKGCDGVEPDNVDEYANNNGLGITAADQIDFNTFIAEQAHARGLSVGLKNDLDQVNQLEAYFDWALDEQCNQYSECSTLTPFVTAGKAVFGVEYQGSPSTFCPTMVADKFSWLLKDLNLDAQVTQCCTYAAGGCATKPPASCYTPATSKRSLAPAEETVAVEDVKLVQEPEFSAASIAYPAAFLGAVALAFLF